jgi:IS1 family transposase
LPEDVSQWHGIQGYRKSDGSTSQSLIGFNKKAKSYLMQLPQTISPMWANGMNWKHLSGQKNKIWVWTAVDHFRKGILAWTLGDHSAETFEPGQVAWQCYFYVTDGWTVYPSFIPDGDQIISKTYMTRVEGENSRLRHYLARLHRNTFCYSKSVDMLRYSVRLLIHYLHDPSVLFSL